MENKIKEQLQKIESQPKTKFNTELKRVLKAKLKEIEKPLSK